MKKSLACLLVAWLALTAAALNAQRGPAPSGPRPFSIVATDPSFREIVSPDARLEVLGDRFGLTEGPLWIDDEAGGSLLFSDLIANVIYKRTAAGELTVFLDRAGYSGSDINSVGQQTRRGRMAVILTGPNGLALDPQGRLIYCAMADRALMRLEKDRSRTVVADRYEGKRLSGPNDVIVRSDGAVYFTDSVNGLRGGGRSADRELEFSGLYLVRNGTVTLLAGDRDTPGGFPNGLALSPDEKHLYMNVGFLRIMRYDVNADGTIGNPLTFIEGEGSDGMKVDLQGNLYTTSGAGPGRYG